MKKPTWWREQYESVAILHACATLGMTAEQALEQLEKDYRRLLNKLIAWHASHGLIHNPLHALFCRKCGYPCDECKCQPLTVREACRRRMSLDGADAQALEHALTITERERDEARALCGEYEALICPHCAMQLDACECQKPRKMLPDYVCLHCGDRFMAIEEEISPNDGETRVVRCPNCHRCMPAR